MRRTSKNTTAAPITKNQTPILAIQELKELTKLAASELEMPLVAVNDCSGSFEWYASATFHSEDQAARVSAATNDR
jgi:hypothetical protein